MLADNPQSIVGMASQQDLVTMAAGILTFGRVECHSASEHGGTQDVMSYLVIRPAEVVAASMAAVSKASHCVQNLSRQAP